MAHKENLTLDIEQFKEVLDRIPVGVTVIDTEGHILYYNEYSSQVVERKPEFIGEDIRSCHKKPESIAKIDRILSEIKEGKRRQFHYESERNGKVLRITVSPYEADGQLIGFIQTFVVKN